MVCLLGSRRVKATCKVALQVALTLFEPRVALLKANSRGFTRSEHLVLQADIRVRILGSCCISQTETTCPSQSLLTRFASAPVESVFPVLSTVVKRVRAMSDTHTDSKPMV